MFSFSSTVFNIIKQFNESEKNRVFRPREQALAE